MTPQSFQRIVNISDADFNSSRFPLDLIMFDLRPDLGLPQPHQTLFHRRHRPFCFFPLHIHASEHGINPMDYFLFDNFSSGSTTSHRTHRHQTTHQDNHRYPLHSRSPHKVPENVVNAHTENHVNPLPLSLIRNRHQKKDIENVPIKISEITSCRLAQDAKA
jgi:hypothetical protein